MEKIAVDENGWIRGGPAENVALRDGWEEKGIETDKDIEPCDPTKHEKAWHWNGGIPELRETGNPQPPTVEERIENLEKAAGVNGTGKQGIAQRIDELEQRVSDLENSS